MRGKVQTGQRDRPRGLIASFAVHVLVVGALMLRLDTPLPIPPEESVTVEILGAEQFERERPASAALPKPASQPGAMIRVTQFLSARTLADPRSRQAAETLTHMETAERMIQLCNIEAMVQVRAWRDDFRPETLVAYAMAGIRRFGDAKIEVDGGAFRSKRHWYNIRFKCQVAPDFAKVIAFEFQVGEEIPESEWVGHHLTAEGAAFD